MTKGQEYNWLTRVHRYALLVPDKRVMVLRVEKTGQTSYARWIVQDKCPHTVLDWRRDVYTWEAAFFGALDTKPRLTVYAMVRNPWDRMVSNWHHMFREGSTNLPFDAFVRSSWPDTAPYDNWIQFQPCSYWTHYEGVQMADEILRFEDFEESAKTIAKAVDAEIGAVPHENRGAHKPYREYYDDELVEIVGERYQEDVENFGYTFEERKCTS